MIDLSYKWRIEPLRSIMIKNNLVMRVMTRKHWSLAIKKKLREKPWALGYDHDS